MPITDFIPFLSPFIRPFWTHIPNKSKLKLELWKRDKLIDKLKLRVHSYRNEEIVCDWVSECVLSMSAKLLRWLQWREKEWYMALDGLKYSMCYKVYNCALAKWNGWVAKEAQILKKKHTASNNEYRSKKPAESFSLYIAIYEAILISVITLYTMHLIGFYTAAYAFLLSLFLLLCSAVSEWENHWWVRALTRVHH